METISSGSLWSMKNALFCSVVFGAFTISPMIHAQEFSEIHKEEVKNRLDRSMEAKKQVAIGDEAYTAAQYKDSVDAYSQALGLLPDAKITEDYAQAVRDRYSKAIVEYSKFLTRQGRVDEAQELLSRLSSTKAYEDDPLIAHAENDVYDPIRVNPSSTGEHGKNVDNVRLLLYKAQGAIDLGLFDEALTHYDAILRIDPTNSAARRGQQAVHKEKSAYGRAAYDEARANLLTKVDQAWEIEPVGDLFLGSPISSLNGEAAPIESDIRLKLDQIVIPRFEIDDSTIDIAVGRFKQLLIDHDPEPDQLKKGVNVVLNLGGELNPVGKEISERNISLNLGEMPASALLDLICKQSKTEWSADQYSVSIVPAGQLVDQLFSRTFAVPPNFLAKQVQSDDGGEVLFADVGSGGADRVDLTIESYLKSLGITFPEGAKASYVPFSNTVTMVNTPSNMRILSTSILKLKNSENVVVNVRLKVLDILQEDLEELGYDAIFTDKGIGNGLFLGGGNEGNGVGGPGFATSGLRSGGNAFTGDTIDSRIGEVTNLSQIDANLQEAPGILTVTAIGDDATAQFLLKGVNQKKGTSSLWAPSISIRPGEQGRIEEVRLFTYPTEYDPPEIPDNVRGSGNIPIIPAIPTAFEERPIGRSFQVSAVVDNEKRYISLDLEPLFDEFLGFINYGSPILGIGTDALGSTVSVNVTSNDILLPIFEKVTTKTNVTIADGNSVVIGGLTRVEVQQVNDRVPVLGSLPFVGNYFKSAGTETLKRAIIIIASVELVDTLGRPWRDKN